jgi:hypothetical protein
MAGPSSFSPQAAADNTTASSVQLEDNDAKKGNNSGRTISSCIKNVNSGNYNNSNKNDSHHHNNKVFHETCLDDPERRSVISPPPSWQIKKTLSSPPSSPKNADDESLAVAVATTPQPKSGTVREPEAFKYLSEADRMNLLNEDRDRHYMRFSTLQSQQQMVAQQQQCHRQQVTTVAAARVNAVAPLYDINSQADGSVDQPISSMMASALTTPPHRHHHIVTVEGGQGHHHHMINDGVDNTPHAHTSRTTISRTTCGAADVADSIVGGSGVPFS